MTSSSFHLSEMPETVKGSSWEDLLEKENIEGLRVFGRTHHIDLDTVQWTGQERGGGSIANGVM